MSTILDRKFGRLGVVALKRAVEEVRICKAPILRRSDLRFVPLRLKLPGVPIIDRMTIRAGDDPEIIRRLGAPLDLDRVDDAALHDRVDVRSEVEIFGVHDIRPHTVFFETEGGARLTVVGVDLIREAAIVGAAAPVGDASGLKRGDEAASAVGKTHRSVDKDFDLKVRECLFDRGQIFQTDLPSGDDPAHPHVVIDLGIVHIHDIRLSREVDRDLGRDLAHHPYHARRGDDERIGPKLCHLGNVPLIRAELGIEREAVDGAVHLLAPRMSIRNPLGKTLDVKLFATAHPQRKTAHPAVHRIGTVGKSQFEFVKVPRRGKKFCPIFHAASCVIS